MRLELITETQEDVLVKRAIEARATTLDKTVTELYAPWTVDQAGAAVNRMPLAEATVQAAEARARAAADERTRIEAEKLATALVDSPE